ncbi:MAG TPA: AMP-binding protein [Mycobacteriales bacterium]|nr:AMP-binding protein [Mycobacteriales bacterium]
MQDTLAELAEETFDRLGDHEALWFEGRAHRSGELFARARRAAAGLVRCGIRPGDRVVILMANCPEVGITYGAVWAAGAVVTPVVFLITPTELQHILVDSEAVAVVTTTELLTTVVTAVEHSPTVRWVIVAGPTPEPAPEPASEPASARVPAGYDVVAFGELEAEAEGAIVDRVGSDLATLMYTGGTTGRSKGVMLTHQNLLFCARSAHEASYVPGVTRGLLPLPLSHAYGMIVYVVGLHAVEPGFNVLQRWFDPVEWIRLCAEHRIQRSSLVPAMLQMLLAQPLEEADLGALRYVGSGAAPLARETILEFERRVPSCQVLEGYGCTESAAVISVTRPGQRRIGSVGTPIPGYDIRILNDGLLDLPIEQDGEICVRSPGVMAGYWRADDANAATLVDGWLHTGDIGHLDADGYLYVVDRKKDLIIRGGFNVYPRDVEDVLLAHPAVAMAGVVGRPDPRLGEEVVAFVALRPGAEATPEQLLGFARDRLASTKYPREIHLLDAVPLTSVGKLDRKALRGRLTDGSGRPGGGDE